MKVLMFFFFSNVIFLSSEAQNPCLIGKWSMTQFEVEPTGMGELINLTSIK